MNNPSSRIPFLSFKIVSIWKVKIPSWKRCEGYLEDGIGSETWKNFIYINKVASNFVSHYINLRACIVLTPLAHKKKTQKLIEIKKIIKTVLVIYFLFLGKVYIVQILFPDGSSKYAK